MLWQKSHSSRFQKSLNDFLCIQRQQQGIESIHEQNAIVLVCPSFEMFTDGSTKVTLFVTGKAGRDSFQRLALRRLTDGLKSAIMQPCYAPVNYIWFTFVLWLWQAQQGISVSKEVSSSGVTFLHQPENNQETASRHQMKTGEIVQTVRCLSWYNTKWWDDSIWLIAANIRETKPIQLSGDHPSWKKAFSMVQGKGRVAWIYLSAASSPVFTKGYNLLQLSRAHL